MSIPKTVEWVGGAKIDSREWPVLRVTFPSRATTEDELRDTLDRLRAIARLGNGGPRHVVIAELPSAMRPPPRHRMIAADWLASLDADDRAATLSCYLVIQSAVVRGFVTAVTWLRPPAIELVTVDSDREAVAKARLRLEADAPPLVSARAS